MKRYPLLEILAFGAAYPILVVLFDDNTVAAYWTLVISYAVLQLLSALAFCFAIDRGLVQEHAPAPYRYSVTRECERHWLVMRHIWAYLRLAERPTR